MTHKPATFSEFQATGRDVPCVDTAADGDYWAEPNTPGRIYGETLGGHLVIERCEDGEFFLVIAQQSWKTSDLQSLETELYKFYLEEMQPC